MNEVGHFRDDCARERFLEVYRDCLALLPPYAESLDVPTSFGTVRVYRFDGPSSGRPALLLPGRNASTPMWRANLEGVLERRAAYCIDLLGEAGLSVQHRPISTADDQAHWLDETIAGLGHDALHLMGVSIGGWTATNCAIRRPGRIASLTLLDPVMTFAPLPIKTILVSGAMFSPRLPEGLRRRILRWISGGADADDTVPEARLIAASSVDFVLRQPMPKRFTEAELRKLNVPVLALIAGRSVMLDAQRAAAHARKTLRYGRVELWPAASHALNGEFPDEIASAAGEFWDEVDR